MRLTISHLMRSQIALTLVVVLTTVITATHLWNGHAVAKTFAFLITSALLMVLLVVVFLRERHVYVHIVDLFFLAFVLYLSVQILSSSTASAFNHRYIEWSDLFLLYLFVRLAVARRQLDLHFIVVIFLSVGVVQLVWGYLQLYGVVESYNEYFKITGSFANPSPFSVYVSLLFPVAGLGYLFAKGSSETEKAIRVLSIGYLLLFLSILPSTDSRTAWLMSMVTGAIIFFKWILDRSKVQFVLSRRWIVICIPVFAIISVFVINRLYEYKKDSADGRLLIWKLTGENVGDRLVFGHGYESFHYVYNKIQSEYFGKNNGSESERRVADYVPYAFNDYLQMVFEGGMVKLLLFLGIISNALLLRFEENWILFAFRLSVIAFLISSFFTYTLEVLPSKVILAIVLGALAGKSESFILKLRRPAVIVLPLIAMAFCLSVALPLRQYNAYTHWVMAYLYNMGGMPEAAIELYETAYPVLKNDSQFLQSYGKAFSLLGDYEKSNELLYKAAHSSSDPVLYSTLGYNHQRLGRYSDAERYYAFADNVAPSKFYSKLLLARMYFEQGEVEKFSVIANQILSMEVKVKSEAMQQIKSEVKAMLSQLRSSGELKDNGYLIIP